MPTWLQFTASDNAFQNDLHYYFLVFSIRHYFAANEVGVGDKRPHVQLDERPFPLQLAAEI